MTAKGNISALYKHEVDGFYLRFLEELGSRGDVSVHFTKTYPYVGTALAARLGAEGRLAGTDAAPDYRFLDPRLDLFQGFLSEAFHERNFGAAGLVGTARRAAFDLELLSRFGRGRSRPDRYRSDLCRITAEGNAVALAAMWRALAALERRSPADCLALWPHLRELARAAREEDGRLARALRQVMDRHGYDEPRLRPAAGLPAAP